MLLLCPRSLSRHVWFSSVWVRLITVFGLTPSLLFVYQLTIIPCNLMVWWKCLLDSTTRESSDNDDNWKWLSANSNPPFFLLCQSQHRIVLLYLVHNSMHTDTNTNIILVDDIFHALRLCHYIRWILFYKIYTHIISVHVYWTYILLTSHPKVWLEGETLSYCLPHLHTIQI